MLLQHTAYGATYFYTILSYSIFFSRNAIEEEKSRCQELEAELEGERVLVKRLKNMLNSQKEAVRSAKVSHA